MILLGFLIVCVQWAKKGLLPKMQKRFVTVNSKRKIKKKILCFWAKMQKRTERGKNKHTHNEYQVINMARIVVAGLYNIETGRFSFLSILQQCKCNSNATCLYLKNFVRICNIFFYFFGAFKCSALYILQKL